MARAKSPDPKTEALRQQGTLHPAPASVADPRFADSDFFDARDLVQTRYEMLRRVRTEGHSVTAATAWYGVSRPTFYKLLAAFEREGLWGLLPRKAGAEGPPQAAAGSDHLTAGNAGGGSVGGHGGSRGACAGALRHRCAPAYGRARPEGGGEKKTALTAVSGDGDDVGRSPLVADYEQLRCAALGTAVGPASGLGVVMRRGLAVWMRAAGGAHASCARPSSPCASGLKAVPDMAVADMVTILTQMVMTAAPAVRP